MAVMRQSWTDDRLDDFRARVDERFDGVDRRLDRIDDRLNTDLPRLDQRIDGLHRAMLQGFLVLVGIQVTFFVATIGFIATQT